jgi:catechol 2,3-dioxygenase-like lactoylglutathione lyase family enzyme
MRTSIVFVTGLLVGSFLAPGFAQDTRLAGMNNMNHVGISVRNFDAALAFYTQKMGFREAFVYRGAKGEPQLAYMQLGRNSFVELQPANATRPPGLTHYGLVVDDLKATVATLKQRGVTVEEPRPGRQDSFVANAKDPEGIEIEFFQLGPNSPQSKASASWK